MAKNILYIGGFNFNNTNASSIRVIENAKFLKKLNHEVEVLGKIESEAKEPIYIDNIKVSSILKDEGGGFASDISTIKLKAISSNINCIIAYNYPPIAFYKLLKFCKKKNIELIPDLTEWYAIDGKITFDKWLRYAMHQWRMLFLNKRCKNKFVASSYLDKYYKKSNNLLLPFVTIDFPVFEKNNQINSNAISFVYAGSPGNNFSKDRLDIVLKAFAKAKEQNNNFLFKIVGLTRDELYAMPSVRKAVTLLDENLKCFGRLKNDQCINILKKSNFVVFARDINRVTSAGFPTKVFEAFKYGLPVLTNKTSDIDKYVNNKNGFLVENANVGEFSNKINTILTIKEEMLEEIITNCRKNNPFFYCNYKKKTELFFKKID
jgi:glycosyltransferase involved in cell wall biosynthesis